MQTYLAGRYCMFNMCMLSAYLDIFYEASQHTCFPTFVQSSSEWLAPFVNMDTKKMETSKWLINLISYKKYEINITIN